MASPIVAIGKERNKEYTRIEDENCNNELWRKRRRKMMVLELDGRGDNTWGDVLDGRGGK